MSNTYKTIIAIITLAILAAGAGIYLNSQNRNLSNQNSLTITSSTQATSSQNSQLKSVTSSSQVIKPISSETISEVKVSQVPVVQTGESNKDVISSCTNPDPVIIQLINKNDLCFGFINWDNESLNNFIEKENLYNLNDQLLINYYKRVDDKFQSEFKIVNILFYKIIDPNTVEVTLSMQDNILLLTKYPKLIEIAGPYDLNRARYSLTKNPATSNWSIQFIEFEN